MAERNYWWVTRPKRKLNSIPEVLAAFSNVALAARWTGRRDIHIQFEEELEKSGLKRVGERRDQSGSGGRTYQAWLYSLGLVFIQESTGMPYLTLAGEAIMEGRSPTAVLKEQVLKYQFPSAFSIKTRVSERIHVHPFIMLLRLLMDSRICYLSEEEIAKIVITEGENDSDQCYEYIVRRICEFREHGDRVLAGDFFEKYAPSNGRINPDCPFRHLTDIANTLGNWLEYTQLTCRDDGKIMLLPECVQEVAKILDRPHLFIRYPENSEAFQRKYGVDPWHQKDTRNLLNTSSISSKAIESQRIRQAFIALSMRQMVSKVDSQIVQEIADRTGTSAALVEDVLHREYPHGAVGGFLSSYYEMAFRGRDEAVDFEKATTNIFRDVFGYCAVHLGQTGSRSAPDILLVSEAEGYQAIIDNKAYSKYSITGDHHNRMVHNYIGNIRSYSEATYPIGFFAYVAGGFASSVDRQIQSEAAESNTPGAGISVVNMIKMIERHQKKPYTHQNLRKMFGVNRQIHLSDLET